VSVRAKKSGSAAIKILFALSGAAMTLLLSQGGSLLFIGAGVFLSLVVCLIVAFRFDLPRRAFVSPKPLPLVLGVVLAAAVALLYRPVFTATVEEVIVPFLAASPLASLANAAGAVLPILVCVLALFALFVWFSLFADQAVRFVRRWSASSCRAERLYVLIGFVLVSAAIALVYSRTTAFFSGAEYDVVYTTDSGNLISTNAFHQVNAYQNDIRQPLFAVFSMPFSVLSVLLSKLLFFVPNAYPIVIACVQAGLLLFSFTLLARVLGLTGTDRVLFLLLLAVSYPTLLFFFTIEQYIFSGFWVIVLLYAWHENSERRTMLYVAATGSLLTSGVFFPLLFEEKGAKKAIRSLVSAGLLFFAVFVVFGRVPMLNRALQTARDLASFTGERVSVGARALQFFSFVSSCFARPAAGVDLATYSHASFQMLAANGINWLGLALIVLSLVSAILHRKDAPMRVFSLWAGFSVVLLLLVGWGSFENGMVLYTLYFSWANAALLYALLGRIARKNNALRYCIAAASILLLLCINLPGMLDLFRFAVAYYPVA
jgi:hypothetical protein